jgi:hypothetical protein
MDGETMSAQLEILRVNKFALDAKTFLIEDETKS